MAWIRERLSGGGALGLSSDERSKGSEGLSGERGSEWEGGKSGVREKLRVRKCLGVGECLSGRAGEGLGAWKGLCVWESLSVGHSAVWVSATDDAARDSRTRVAGRLALRSAAATQVIGKLVHLTNQHNRIVGIDVS